MEMKTGRTNRVLEIELMKAVAIMGMVFVHVYEMSIRMKIISYNQSMAAFIIQFFGCVLSAGVFMFAMGWGAAYSKSATPRTYVRRALSLFILGVVINLFEEYLPAILVPDAYGPLSEMLPSILTTDIFFFAALMSLFFALLKKLEARPGLAVSLSVILLAVCFSINLLVGFESFTLGNEWMDTVLGLFIRVNEYSCFPFISWFVFPIVGYWLSVCFQKTDMKKAVIFAVATGVAAIAAGELLIRASGLMDAAIFDVVGIPEGYYYALHPYYALVGYGLIAIEFAAAHLILRLSRQRLPQFMLTMSKNVTQIYVVQWLLIGLLSPLLVSITSVWANILAALVILFIAYIGGILLKKTNLVKV